MALVSWRCSLHLFVTLWWLLLLTTVALAESLPLSGGRAYGESEELSDLNKDSPHPRELFSSEPVSETTDSLQPNALAPAESIADKGSDAAVVDIEDDVEPGENNAPTLDPNTSTPDFVVFPVGVSLGNRNVLPTTLVKGNENGERPIDFEQWQLSFDDVVQVLNVQVTVWDDGELELRSPAAVTRIHPNEFTIDPNLGRVLSIAEIEAYLGISATFDMADYVIRFAPPEQRSQQQQTVVAPIVTDGLPELNSNRFSLSGIGQQTTLSGRTASGDRSGSTNWRGRFNAVGTAFGGAWYAEIDQPSLDDQSSWYLNELQYLHYGDHSDYTLGSQPTFWQSQGGDYWGATLVQRWGFEPPAQRGSGGFNPRRRLQATNLDRTVSGEAEPGTLVQLARNNQVIDEVLVDSSGLYRFTDVATTGFGRYRVLLFPDGQLAASPDEYDATFSSLPGQLPMGASALVLSAGFNRQRNNQEEPQFWGDFHNFRGGIGYRTGVSESLTLGAGVIQDSSLTLLSEVFYSPSNIPLKAAMSVMLTPGDSDVDVNADMRWQPTDDLAIDFNSDRFSQRLRADWQLLPSIALTASGNTRDDALAVGTRVNLTRGKFYLFGLANVDTNGNLRWHTNARYGSLGLRHRGDEITTQSQLIYNLSGNPANSLGHSLNIGYETRNLNDFSQLAMASWRYQSSDRNIDGRSLWDIELGYGIGTAGSGPFANFATGILPGLDLRARYQEVSAFSDQSTFRLELSPRLNLQQGLNFGNRRQDWLRTQGGLMIQPFLDDNNNGQQDPGESTYLEDLDLLITINHESLDRYQPHRQKNYATVVLAPGVYRIDLDPAGFPLDRQAVSRAFAADIAPGEYTHLSIPLGLSFSISGVVLDADGNAMAGQNVQAIHTSSDSRHLSVTNGAGVFYLEGMPQGDYRFEIGERSVADTILNFNDSTEPFQEINFKVRPDAIETQRPRLDIGSLTR
ncbi:carboxypeptidase-like regulatory domain-containing protein [Leptothoe sp. EHU-05/26/07-4]